MNSGFDRRLLAPRYWGRWLVAGLLWLLSRLPRPVSRRVGFCLGSVIARLNAKRRGNALTNLRLCFPEITEEQRAAMVKAHFRVMGRVLLDYPLLWSDRVDDLVTIDGGEHLADARAAGRAIILLTAHGLALDIAGIALAKRAPLLAFVKPARDEVAEWLINHVRSQYGSVLHRRNKGLRPVLRDMADGYAFYYLPDEDLKREHLVFAPFFGVPKATLTAPGRLARLADAVVLPCMGYWLPETDRYLVRILEPLGHFPGGDEIEDATRINQVIEGLVREHPEQYLWTFRFFHTRPERGPSPYRR